MKRKIAGLVLIIGTLFALIYWEFLASDEALALVGEHNSFDESAGFTVSGNRADDSITSSASLAENLGYIILEHDGVAYSLPEIDDLLIMQRRFVDSNFEYLSGLAEMKSQELLLYVKEGGVDEYYYAIDFDVEDNGDKRLGQRCDEATINNATEVLKLGYKGDSLDKLYKDLGFDKSIWYKKSASAYTQYDWAAATQVLLFEVLQGARNANFQYVKEGIAARSKVSKESKTISATMFSRALNGSGAIDIYNYMSTIIMTERRLNTAISGIKPTILIENGKVFIGLPPNTVVSVAEKVLAQVNSIDLNIEENLGGNHENINLPSENDRAAKLLGNRTFVFFAIIFAVYILAGSIMIFAKNSR